MKTLTSLCLGTLIFVLPKITEGQCVISRSISGDAIVCAGVVKHYETQPGMTQYNWQLSAGTSLGSGGTATDNFIDVGWLEGGNHTISVNYIDVNNCTASSPAVKNITVNAMPVPQILGSASTCQGSVGNIYTTDNGMSAYTWSTSAAMTGTLGNTATITAPAGIGNFLVSVQYTNQLGCRNLFPSKKTVAVTGQLPASLFGDFSTCIGSSGNTFTTDVGMSSYNWMIPAGATATAGGTSVDSFVTLTMPLTPGSGELRVSYLNNSCPTTSGPQAVYYSPPVTPTLNGNLTSCTGLIQTYSSDSNQSNYIWTISSGGTIVGGGSSTDYTVSVVWNTPGVKMVTVTYTSGACSPVVPIVKTITVSPGTLPSLNGPTTGCVAAESIFTTDANKSNYEWTTTNGYITGGSTNSIRVFWTTLGTHSVTVKYTDGTCSTGTPTSKSVVINALPVPNMTGPASVCLGVPGNIFTTDANKSQYTWQVALAGAQITAGGTPLSNTATMTFNMPGLRSIYIGYTDINGCTATIEKTVNVVTEAVRTINFPPDIPCIGQTRTYSTEAGMNGYAWTVTGGTITSVANSSSVNVIWNQAGNQTISVYYITPSCNNPLPTTAIVNVPSGLSVTTIDGPTTACTGASGQRTYSAFTPGVSHNWNVTGGSIISGNGTSSVVVQWNTAGNQTISVNYTSVGSCVVPVTGSKAVNVESLPLLSIVGPDRPCHDTNENFIANAGAQNYIWSASNGTVVAGNGTANVLIRWTQSGNQTISLTQTTLSGCSASTSKSIYVRPRGNPTLSATPNAAAVCQGFNHVFTTNSVSGATYTWSLPSGANIVSGGTSTSNQLSIDWLTIGNKTVSVNLSSDFQCPALMAPTISVNVKSSPTPPISGGQAEVCFGTPSSFSTTSDMSNYQWIASNGTIIGQGTNAITVNWTSAGTQWVSLNYTNAEGCIARNATVYNVNVKPAPGATINGLSTACLDQTGVLYTTEAGKTGYNWSLSAGAEVVGASNSNTINIIWRTGGSKTVSVSYVNSNGCTSSSSNPLGVFVNPRPIPNITGSRHCLSGVNTYSTESGKQSYVWTTSPDGMIDPATANTNSINVTWGGTGAKTVTVTYTQLGCTSVTPGTKSVTVNPMPVASINALSGSIDACPGDYKVYVTQGGMQGYNWFIDNVYQEFSVSSDIGKTWNGSPATHTVSVIYSDNNNCVGQKTIYVKVGNLPQSLVFNAIPNWSPATGSLIYPLMTTSTGPGTLSFTSSGGVATIMGTNANIFNIGTTTITATKAATSCYAMETSQQTLTTVRSTPVITFTALADKIVGNPPFTLTAASSANLGTVSPITFSSSNPAVATISGNTVTIGAAGTTTITANQTASTFYNAAASVGRTLTVRGNQTITFNSVPAKTVGDSFTLNASASSGLPVAFTTSNASIASISGNVLTCVAVGTVTITARQAGNGIYNPAPDVARSLTIYNMPVATISATSNSICTTSGITLTAANNAAGCVYLWSTVATTQNVTVTAAGNYIVTVTNQAGKSVTSSPFTVLDRRVSITRMTSPFGCTVLQASPGATYSWTRNSAPTGNGASEIRLTTGGSYSVVVTEPVGCPSVPSGTATLSSSATSPTSIVTIQGPNTICPPTWVTLTASLQNNPGLGDQVSMNNVFIRSPTSYGASKTVKSAGLYTVSITDVYGCTITDQHTLTVSCTNTMRMAEDSDGTLTATVSPNPASKVIVVTLPAPATANIKLSLIDQFGQVVDTSTISEGLNNASVDVSGLTGHIYFLMLEQGGNRVRQRVLVMK